MRQAILGMVAGLALGAAGVAVAQAPHQGHGATGPTANAVIKEFKDASARMHHAMDVRLTGDADKDFVASMIPHHEGAIDMAKIALKYGKDPEIRKLAEAVIREQTREITEMRAWQASTK